MRSLAVVVVMLLSLVTHRSLAGAETRRTPKRVATTTAADAPAKPAAETKQRDRSIGVPWSGRLQGPARLVSGEGYHLRRPWRTYATRTTVNHVRRAILDTRKAQPRAHILAVGDLSAEAGGRITEHASHQSGRDVDLGLFYKKQPGDYPAKFVRATAATLDVAATWRLLANLARTADEDGGAQIIFLDYDLQRILYQHAKKQGAPEKRLAKLFQYPNGRSAASGLVRHIPHHDDHLHVRYKCRVRDTACR